MKEAIEAHGADTSTIPSSGSVEAKFRRLPLFLVAIELTAAFALGAGIMAFVYVDHRGVPADQIGLPGYDSWYHTKMAVLLPEIGMTDTFPWLRFVFFRQSSDAFVSHHTGFHLLLVPFTYAAHALTGDYLPGARWAMIFCFGMVAALIDGLLLSERLRWRWLWLICLTLCGADFLLRHSYIRAICPSLCFMLTLLLCVFRRRVLIAGVVAFLYVHLYLGGVIYGPIVVGAYALAAMLQPPPDRRVEWKLLLVVGAAVGLAILTHPYSGGVIEFLRLQVFGSGLTPDIEVGNEWQSYGNVWGFFQEQIGLILALWTLALLLRLASRVPLNAQSLTLIMLSVVFFCLTIKAKRFIEYSPVFFLVSAAFLAAPAIERIAEWLHPRQANLRWPQWLLRSGFILLLILVAAGHAMRSLDGESIDAILQQWSGLLMLGLVMMLAPIAAIWIRGARQIGGATAATIALIAIPLSGALVKIILEQTMKHVFRAPAPSASAIAGGYVPTSVLAILYLSATLLVAWRLRGAWQREPTDFKQQLAPTLNAILGVVAIMVIGIPIAGPSLARAQRDSWCGFNLGETQRMMAHVREISNEGDVIFTDDWDVFPLFFYFNSYNRYVVGLDPKFTQSRMPELWERYVHITRGQTPFTSRLNERLPNGNIDSRTLDIRLEDIRTHFGAKYVIADRDHKGLARQLLERRDFARLVYPMGTPDRLPDSEYLVFEVHASPGPALDGAHASRRP